MDLLEDVYPLTRKSLSEHNVRHFIETLGTKGKAEKLTELRDLSKDIRRMISGVCEEGMVVSERKWQIFCDRIRRRIQQTKNKLSYGLLSRRLDAAFEWARTEVHADDIEFAPPIPENPEEARLRALEEFAVSYVPMNIMRPKDTRSKEPNEDPQPDVVGTEEIVSPSEPQLTTMEIVSETVSVPKIGFIATLDAERGERSREEHLLSRIREFLLGVFDEDFLRAIRDKENELKFDDALSEQTVRGIAKLVRTAWNTVEETLKPRLTELFSIYEKTQSQALAEPRDESSDDAEKTFIQAVWNNMRNSLHSAEEHVQHRLLQYGRETKKFELPRAVLEMFRSHCLENCRSYLDIISEPTEIATNLPRFTVASPLPKSKTNGHPEQATLDPIKIRILERLMPSKYGKPNAPFSHAEQAFLVDQITALSKSPNRGHRQKFLDELCQRFSGGIQMRSEEFLRGVLEREIMPLVVLNRQLATKPPEPKPADLPPRPPRPPKAAAPVAPKKVGEEEILKRYLERNIVTPMEAELLVQLSSANEHRRNIRNGRFGDIVNIVNEQCWGGQPERDGTFVRNVMRALELSVIVHDGAFARPGAMSDVPPATGEARIAAPAEAAPEDIEHIAARAPATDTGIPTEDTSTESPLPTQEPAPAISLPEVAARFEEQALTPTMEKARATAGYFARLHQRILTHSELRLSPRNRLPLLFAEVQTLNEEAEALWEKLDEFRTDRQRDLEALRTGAVLLRTQIDALGITDERIRATVHLGSVEELRTCAQSFLSDTATFDEELKNFGTKLVVLQEEFASIEKNRLKADTFFSRELLRHTISATTADVHEFIRTVLGDESAALLSDDPVLQNQRNDVGNLLDAMSQGVLKDIDKCKDIGRRREDAAAVLASLSVLEAMPAHAATTAPSTSSNGEGKPEIKREPASVHLKSAVQGPPLDHRNSSLLRLTATKMTMGTRRDPREFDMNLLQVRLLQMLVVFPTQVQSAGVVKPISSKYKSLYMGRGISDLIELWKQMFGEPTPDKEEVKEALDALSSEGWKGLEKSPAGPKKEEREASPTPLIKFRNKVGHLRYVPADRTYDFMRSLTGGVALTAAFEHKLVAILDAGAHVKAEKSLQKRTHSAASHQAKA